MSALAQAVEDSLGKSPLLALPLVFAGGVLTSFTPCVYPVIPIIVGYIGGTRERSKLRAFLLSLCYVIGMAITYAALGAFAGLTGRLFGRVQANPITNIVVGNIILLFGLSLLGVFTLPMPRFLRAAGGAQAPGRRRLLSAALMGLASGFVTAPCTAAVLVVLLAYVAAEQNVLFGIIALFVFALGMGVLLLLIGTFTGVLAALPKAGRWMERIEKGFGWAMLALGGYFIIRGATLFG